MNTDLWMESDAHSSPPETMLVTRELDRKLYRKRSRYLGLRHPSHVVLGAYAAPTLELHSEADPKDT